MKLVLSLLLFAFSGGTAYAQTPHVDRIDVPEYGIYTANMDSKVPAPGTATGTRNVVGNVQHEATTRTVPAQLGVHFGFRQPHYSESRNEPQAVPGPSGSLPRAGRCPQRSVCPSPRPVPGPCCPYWQCKCRIREHRCDRRAAFGRKRFRLRTQRAEATTRASWRHPPDRLSITPRAFPPTLLISVVSVRNARFVLPTLHGIARLAGAYVPGRRRERDRCTKAGVA